MILTLAFASFCVLLGAVFWMIYKYRRSKSTIKQIDAALQQFFFRLEPTCVYVWDDGDKVWSLVYGEPLQSEVFHKLPTQHNNELFVLPIQEITTNKIHWLCCYEYHGNPDLAIPSRIMTTTDAVQRQYQEVPVRAFYVINQRLLRTYLQRLLKIRQITQ